jgi:hypothetical protein
VIARNAAPVFIGNLLLLAVGAGAGWGLAQFLILYWLESWVILALTMAKVGLLAADGRPWGGEFPDSRINRVGDALSFCAGFALLTWIIGIFVFGMIPHALGIELIRPTGPETAGLGRIVRDTVWQNPIIFIGLIVLAGVHLVELVRTRSDADPDLLPRDLMKASFQRQLVLQVAVVCAAFLLFGLLIGSKGKGVAPLWSALALVLVKVGMEIALNRFRRDDRKAGDDKAKAA